eukprot:scaffold53077_cov64-Phaeocystis_antarctica.AAC.4
MPLLLPSGADRRTRRKFGWEVISGTPSQAARVRPATNCFVGRPAMPRGLIIILLHPLSRGFLRHLAMLFKTPRPSASPPITQRQLLLGPGAPRPQPDCRWRARYAPASWKSRMRLRREWHGMSCLLSSSTPVAGEVLWVLSHCSMALRS